MKKNVLGHIDAMTGIIDRSEAILCVTTTELVTGCGPRKMDDDKVACLLWQVEENMKALRAQIELMWENIKAQGEKVKQ